MFVESPIMAGSIGDPLDNDPEKSACGDDHPFAFVGSLDVM
jgi:hypothetical protein